MNLQTRMYRDNKKALIGVLAGAVLGLTVGMRLPTDNSAKTDYAFQEGNRLGYSQGYQECRKNIALLMKNNGFNPKIRVSDDPSIQPMEIPLFPENQ